MEIQIKTRFAVGPSDLLTGVDFECQFQTRPPEVRAQWRSPSDAERHAAL